MARSRRVVNFWTVTYSPVPAYCVAIVVTFVDFFQPSTTVIYEYIYIYIYK